ncbi:uncharacterized protein LOC132741646 isoform X2 [Ruditapes philippinarum]|uniref:uncharacterized protein LOC132741646 isoform X2 n=1 Tax=Ruditapes philippinarum TaxID=129788 RepID=UPI00295BC8C1|nr:uncharacterized protein LOC132741646 isoform X2 [Ruditapes philippinarum]
MALIFLLLGVVISLPKAVYACSAWSACTVTCGGGTQTRTCSTWLEFPSSSEQSCNTYCFNQGVYVNGRCQCSAWRSGSCCSGCRHVSLPQCFSGHQSCGGSPDGIKCTRCNDAYYSTGYITQSSRYSYALCPTIANCKQRYCSSSSNTRCRECIDDLKLFKRTHSDTKCERMCAWNNHYCWPGSCSNDLTSGCICAPDFKRIQTSTETTCHPTKLPSFLLCNTIFIGTHGQSKRANTNKDGIQNCSSIEDTYGNFQLSLLQYELKTEFKILISGYNQPSYIRNYKFGVTDITINVNKNAANGLTTRISHQQFGDATLNKTINNVRQDNGSIQIDQALSSVAEGESLCIEFEAFGGGYLEGINLITQKVNPYVQYQKVSIKRSLCYTFDHTPPRHCRAIGSCNTEPLNILHPVTRTPINRVSFVGWTDPIPLNGSAKHASTIQDYTISVHQVISKKGRLQLDYSTMYMKVINFSHTDTSLYLKPDKPTLYEVKLEVKDFAGNVQQARRFMLYDDTSFIETRDDKPIIVESASYLTNYVWQTRDTICMTWKDHFINRFYINDNLLGPIKPEQNRLFSGVYEHKFGLLSVDGTLNVNGIIMFSVTVFVNGKQNEETEVTNIQEQSFCKNISNNDGDILKIMVQAVDIAGNVKEENSTVHIDQSKPELELMNISSKLGKIESIELPTSSYNIKFIALDRHSGIHSIVWVFGIKNSGINIATGDIKVNTDNHLQSCHNGTSTCDCFDGKQCESFSYTIPVNALNLCDKKVKDNSNKNFYISITATNFALLEKTRYIDVSIDFTSLDELCKTTNYVPIYVGVSSGISIIILASIMAFVILVVRRKRRKNKQGSAENNGYILESKKVPKKKSKIKTTQETKVTKQADLENYQNLDHNDVCADESYDNIATHPEDAKTRRNTDQKPQRTENNVYEDIARKELIILYMFPLPSIFIIA